MLIGASLLVWVDSLCVPVSARPSDPEEKKVELDIAFPVKISTAHRGTLVKGITSSGLLRPERTVELVPKVSGEIIAVHACEGKEVAKGETVAIIEERNFGWPTSVRPSHSLLRRSSTGRSVHHHFFRLWTLYRPVEI